MVKRLLIFVFVAALTLAVPTALKAASADLMTLEQADEISDVRISVDKSVIRVTGAQGEVLEVISLTGRHVMSVRIESPAQKVELTNIPKGCYIVKVGKVVRKIVI